MTLITSFIPVFEDKLKLLKKDLKKELEKAKSERRKEVMKSLIKEAKGLQETINSVKRDISIECPHCGGLI
tara:strand:+ start:1273 stop:1485 length:213 start_codon:yes stop_codon:yes gene_type:complete